MQWERAFSNPATRVQATAEFMVANGITVHDLFALAGVDPRQYQQQHYQQQYDPVADQANAGSASAADPVFGRQAAL